MKKKDFQRICAVNRDIILSGAVPDADKLAITPDEIEAIRKHATDQQYMRYIMYLALDPWRNAVIERNAIYRKAVAYAREVWKSTPFEK